jgi:hypothetical protein
MAIVVALLTCSKILILLFFFFFFCHYFLLKTVAKIGNSQGKGEVEIIMKRSSSMPGPHDYFEGLPPQRRTPLKALAKEVGLG